ncbi:hypothetical protein CC1G_15818 [Coprinopsis cinerea okayama7|uniref:Uncharacterized protein n=1 Tax=Coprinopsis cinerea (strain Okayama-7 / 130 / ATCC MYA-4618 / FGSC 9003) TaxID=240176 RepID=D6RR32_COPC7|nr:hypothetical protein CC1G_15818 [Coprinopsis cinerea okayama7\|eukprot:XP_002910026.1 hypothetical protein CC1G_15818 [Coprinopsis cinerea okayama7\
MPTASTMILASFFAHMAQTRCLHPNHIWAAPSLRTFNSSIVRYSKPSFFPASACWSKRKHGLTDAEVIQHIKSAFPLSEPAKAFSGTHQSMLLEGPILGLSDPSLAYRALRTLRIWPRRTHFKKAYTIQLWKKPHISYRAEMSQNCPSVPVQMPAVTYSSAMALHLEKTLGDRASAFTPTPLPPDTRAYDAADKYLQNTEECLARMRQLIAVYLTDAEHRLEQQPMLRLALVRLQGISTTADERCRASTLFRRIR